MGEKVDDVERIVVLRANGIGDFVVAVPALEALRAAYPGARITYLGLPWHAELLDGPAGPAGTTWTPSRPTRTWSPASPSTRPASRRFFDKHRDERYDLAIQLHGGGGNSNPFIERLGARVTAGARDARRAPRSTAGSRYAYYQHEVLRFLEVVGLVGAPPVTVEPRLAPHGRRRPAR